MQSYNIVVQSYEGPYDLLLDLIKKNEIDIYDIPIEKITDQYLEYINAAEEVNLDLTSDFILMAANLLELKSKIMLPKRESEGIVEDDPRIDLVDQLVQYEKYKKLSKILGEMESYESGSFYKPQEDFSYLNDVDMLNFDIDILRKTFEKLLKKVENREDEKEHRIYRDEYPIRDCIRIINREIKSRGKISFNELLGEDYSKNKLVSYFLALLELMRVKGFKVVQRKSFDDIWCIWTS